MKTPRKMPKEHLSKNKHNDDHRWKFKDLNKFNHAEFGLAGTVCLKLPNFPIISYVPEDK